jgi:hypothetical protein
MVEVPAWALDEDSRIEKLLKLVFFLSTATGPDDASIF